MAIHFTPEALKFLRGLARHNDRAWFDPRKALYERELKTPMLGLIEEINHGLSDFAPNHVRPPHKAMLRIYRDTRFDAARGAPARPYKTHIAAWWSYAGEDQKMAKTSGAGFYLSLSATRLLIAAGCYMPTPEQLLAIRRHLLVHHAEFRALLAERKLRAAFGPIEGRRLTRAPHGFPPDSPAIDMILPQQWGISVALPPERAELTTLVRDITARFALAAPMVRFLNAPILENGAKSAQFGSF